MTEEFMNGLSLEDMVERSRNIVKASKAQPFKEQVKIPIHEDEKKYPPFVKTIYKFAVKETMSSRDGSDLAGQTITAVEARTSIDLGGHKAYYLDGIGESPIIDTYETDADLEKDREFILFLGWPQDEEQTLLGYDRPSVEGKVRELLAEGKTGPTLVAVPSKRDE